MRFILILLCALFVYDAHAESINIDWIVDGETYTTTTCNIGDDLILPAAPTKYGYTFQGWAMYTPIEYLESTGTQYIDTGINFLYGDEFYFEYMPMASYSTENKGYGAGSDLSRIITGGGRRNGSNVCMYVSYTNLCYTPTLPYDSTLGRRYIENWTIKSGLFSSVLTDVDDGVTYTLSKGGISVYYASGNSVYLWREHLSQYSFPSKLRIYRVWLKRANNTLVRDFIPVLDPDGVPCMYDRVSETFFYNSGTGDFIAGPVIAE